MLPKAIQQRVTNILCDHLGVHEDEVVPDASIQDDLGADSLDCVEIVMALEEEFLIEIPDDQEVAGKRVKEVVSYIESRFSQPAT